MSAPPTSHGKARRRLIAAAVVIALLFLADRYVTVFHARAYAEDPLLRALARGKRGSDPFSLRLADVTPRDWDEMFVMYPYEIVPIDFCSRLPVLWLGPKLLLDEGEVLLVFVRNREVVGYLTVRNHDLAIGITANFSDLPLTPECAVFQVSRSDKGEGHLTWDWPDAVLAPH